MDTASEASSRGGVDQCLQLMCTLIISIGTERFGIKQPKAKIPTRPKDPAEPHPYHVSMAKEEGQIEYSKTLTPEKETENSPEMEVENSPEKEVEISPEKETENSPETETGNLPGKEIQNLPEVEAQNLSGDSPDTTPKPVEGSTMEQKDHTETLTPEETVRRSLRHREPARRFHYPELGNPLVSVVTSLFQGLSTAFTNSLNDSNSRDWLANIPVEVAEEGVIQ